MLKGIVRIVNPLTILTIPLILLCICPIRGAILIIGTNPYRCLLGEAPSSI
jgi:hypothetical protein